MSLSKWLVPAVLLASLTLPVAALRAEEAAPAGEKPAKKKVEKAEKPAEVKKPALPFYYRNMATELELSEAQVADLQAKLDAVKAAEKAYQTEHGAELEAAKKATTEAKAGKDETAIKTAKEAETKLLKQRDAALAEPRAAVMTVLTPAQAAKWKCYNMWTGALGSFKKAELTDEQKQKAKEVCYTYCGQVEQLKADDEPAMKEIRTAAKKRINDEVLTDEQRQLMTPEKPKKEPKVEKTEKPKTE